MAFRQEMDKLATRIRAGISAVSRVVDDVWYDGDIHEGDELPAASAASAGAAAPSTGSENVAPQQAGASSASMNSYVARSLGRASAGEDMDGVDRPSTPVGMSRNSQQSQDAQEQEEAVKEEANQESETVKQLKAALLSEGERLNDLLTKWQRGRRPLVERYDTELALEASRELPPAASVASRFYQGIDSLLSRISDALNQGSNETDTQALLLQPRQVLQESYTAVLNAHGALSRQLESSRLQLQVCDASIAFINHQQSLISMIVGSLTEDNMRQGYLSAMTQLLQLIRSYQLPTLSAIEGEYQRHAQIVIQKAIAETTPEVVAARKGLDLQKVKDVFEKGHAAGSAYSGRGMFDDPTAKAVSDPALSDNAVVRRARSNSWSF